jgi:hypothetical protein
MDVIIASFHPRTPSIGLNRIQHLYIKNGKIFNIVTSADICSFKD